MKYPEWTSLLYWFPHQPYDGKGDREARILTAISDAKTRLAMLTPGWQPHPLALDRAGEDPAHPYSEWRDHVVLGLAYAGYLDWRHGNRGRFLPDPPGAVHTGKLWRTSVASGFTTAGFQEWQSRLQGVIGPTSCGLIVPVDTPNGRRYFDPVGGLGSLPKTARFLDDGTVDWESVRGNVETLRIVASAGGME